MSPFEEPLDACEMNTQNAQTLLEKPVRALSGRPSHHHLQRSFNFSSGWTFYCGEGTVQQKDVLLLQRLVCSL